MKISYTVYDDAGTIINGGLCEFHELSYIQFEEFNNGHMVVAELFDGEDE